MINQSSISVEQAYISMQTAELKLNEAYNDLCNFTKDVVNFREVINTLKKHTSIECKEFAAALLGTTVDSLEALENKGENDTVSKSFSEKLKKLGKLLLDYLAKFTRWFKEQVKKLFVYINKKLTEFRPIKVHYDLDTIKSVSKDIKALLKGKQPAVNLSAIFGTPNSMILNSPEAAREYYGYAAGLLPLLYDIGQHAIKDGNPKEIAIINTQSRRVCKVLQSDLALCFKAMNMKMKEDAEKATATKEAEDNKDKEQQS